MEITLDMILTVCPLIFLAGFIDSIAGGGGLISLPAYLLVRLPPQFALGTNKFSSTFGTAVSVIRYVKSSNVHMKSVLFSAAGALAGSYAGAHLALAVDEKYLGYIMVGALPFIAVLVLTRKNFGEEDRSGRLSLKKIIVLSTLSGLLIGAYDGFFGPGTGTLLILVYTGVIGFNFTVASGNAKVVNLASNIAAIATFVPSGKVVYGLGIPAVLFGILGNWLGSGLAIKKGTKVIRPILVCVLVLLFIKISLDIFNR